MRQYMKKIKSTTTWLKQGGKNYFDLRDVLSLFTFWIEEDFL